MRYRQSMRTTLELDDDVLATAKQLARQEGVTLGQVLSRLARQSLSAAAPLNVRNGAQPFVPGAGVSKPNPEIVNRLRDEA
jgi:hypothetical protein